MTAEEEAIAIAEAEAQAQADREQSNSLWGTVKRSAGFAATGLGEDIGSLSAPLASAKAFNQGQPARSPIRSWAEKYTGPWPEPAPGNPGQQYWKDVGHWAPSSLLTRNPLTPFLAAGGSLVGRNVDPNYGASVGGILGGVSPYGWAALPTWAKTAIGTAGAFKALDNVPDWAKDIYKEHF